MTLTADLEGRLIAGKLRVGPQLGEGGMGRVFRAHHEALGIDVALKVLRTQLSEDPLMRKRFVREARAASRLRCPHTVQIFDFGEHQGGLLYLAMEYLDGVSLQSTLEVQRQFSASRARRVMLQILSALGNAHQRGIIHRDLKPSNVILVRRRDMDGVERDFAKVCDFGLARFLDPHEDGLEPVTELTKQGMIMGTPWLYGSGTMPR